MTIVRPTKEWEGSHPWKKVLLSLISDKVSNKPNPNRNEERLKEAINKAFSDLKTLWYEKAIPACHM